MAYEPKEWICGETITADELNRMERGIADASSSGMTSVLAKIEVNNYNPSSGYDVVSSNYTKDELIAIAENDGMIFAYIYQIMGGYESPVMKRGILYAWSDNTIGFTMATYTYNGSAYSPKVIDCTWNHEDKIILLEVQ